MTFKSITKKEFETSLSSNFTFEDNPHIGLCISGGPDSMALLMLMRDWIKTINGKITALHFNHNLRPESKLEAKILKKQLNKLEVNCLKIEWKHEKINSRVMELAREARYEKIINLCKKLRIINLMTAHNFDDNLETYLMRKKRSKSSLGLSSIPKMKIVDNLRIIRPLLSYKKKRLEATCKKFKIQWIDDKSNFNDNFERIRIRNSLKLKNQKEIEKISAEFHKKKKDNLLVEKKISRFFCKELKFYNFGVFQIDKKKFKKNTNHLQIEILKKLLTTAAGKIFSPKTKSVKIFLGLLKKNESFNFTLHTCLIKVCVDHIKVYKEILAKHEIENFFLKKGSKLQWQNRFTIETSKSDLKFCNISRANWPFLKKKLRFKNIDLNFLTLQSLPVLKIKNVTLIPFLSDIKSFDKLGVKFYFNTVLPLYKKNFF